LVGGTAGGLIQPYLADGTRQSLSQRLELSYPEEGPQVASKTVGARSMASRPSKPPSIFLSYPAEDSRFATRLREELISSGFEVTGSQDFRPGLPPVVAMRKVLEQSDGFLMVASDDALQGSVSDFAATVSEVLARVQIKGG
jgi:hypothetical protein